jgi:RNA polymerase sigma factor (sigma-70 family)
MTEHFSTHTHPEVAQTERERFEELARVALRHARYTLWNPHDAEDVAGETMRKVWETNGLAGMDFPVAYVATTARRTATDILRRRAVCEILPFEDPHAATPGIPTLTLDFEANLENRNTLARIGRAISVLEKEFSETGAKIIRLTAQDMTPQQIAETLGMTPNAVSAQLYRFRIKLHEYLQENES